MTILETNLTNSDANGSLEYHFMEDSWQQLVHIRSLVAQKRAFTVIINGGSILLSINSSGTIYDVEFNIPRSAWEISKMGFNNECQEKFNLNLDISLLNNAILEMYVPITVFTNNLRSVVRFEFGTHLNYQCKCVSQSNNVFALLDGNTLCGFEIIIPTTREGTRKY